MEAPIIKVNVESGTVIVEGVDKVRVEIDSKTCNLTYCVLLNTFLTKVF